MITTATPENSSRLLITDLSSRRWMVFVEQLNRVAN